MLIKMCVYIFVLQLQMQSETGTLFPMTSISAFSLDGNKLELLLVTFHATLGKDCAMVLIQMRKRSLPFVTTQRPWLQTSQVML